MANQFLSDDMITLEALDVFSNSLAAAQHCDRKFEGLFGQSNGTSNNGATVRIRKPNQYSVRTGATYSAQDVVDEYTTLSIDQQIGVDTFVTSADMALSLSSFSNQIIKPQIALLANYVDAYILQNSYTQVANLVGTPGTIPTALSTYLDAGAKLDQFACPRDGQRAIVFGPQMQSNVVDALKGLFNNSKKIGGQFDSGEMGSAVGFDWQMDQNIYTHTVGAQGGTPLVNGPSQTGASLITDAWTAAVAVRLKQGDVFTIAGVYSVNPVSKNSTGVLAQFVVTANASSDVAGNCTISIYPSLTATGNQKTISAAPADNAAITVVGAANTLSAQGMAWHKSAIALAFAELQKPDGVDMSSTKTDKQIGVSMRFVRWYDGDNDRFKARFDVLFGMKVVRPEWATRIASGAA